MPLVWFSLLCILLWMQDCPRGCPVVTWAGISFFEESRDSFDLGEVIRDIGRDRTNVIVLTGTHRLKGPGRTL